MLSVKVISDQVGNYFEMVQGEDVSLNILILDEYQNPFDLTGYTITGRFVSNVGTAEVEGATSSAPTSGRATLTIAAADSSTFQTGNRQDWELSLSKSGANRLIVVRRGVSVLPQTI